MSASPSALLGKYRDLVLAITLFLFLDLGVLIFNFYASQLIEADTARLNRAGELRMYSQQLAKAVLTLQHELSRQLPTQTSLAQVSEADAAFRDAMRALEEGLDHEHGTGWQESDALTEAQAQLGALAKTWEPLRREVGIVLALPAEGLRLAHLEALSQQVFARNVHLMQQANDLTATLENSATRQARSMRQIQLAAIAVALANFVFIVFKFVRRLRQSDRQAEDARQETGRILATVREGLFLIDRQGLVGQQQSASLNNLLGQPLPPGTSFSNWIMPSLSSEQSESCLDYLGLLFSPKVKPALLKDLNPLRELALTDPDGETRYLDFEFEQVKEAGGEVSALLASVSDVTRKVTLQRELAAAEQRAKTEVEAMLAVLEQDPATVDGFLRSTESKLAQINSDLSEVRPEGNAYGQLVNKVARVVHGIKGEAAAIGLSTIEKDIHAFEDVLAPLRGRRDLSGEDLIPLAVALNDVHEATAKVWRVIERVKHYGSAPPESARESRNKLRELLEQIEHMTLHVASDLNKRARLHVASPPPVQLPERTLEFLRTTLPQLIRNAVAHGIEPAEERASKGKPHEGQITCAIDIDDDGTLHISVQDDGAGLSATHLRQRLVDKGLISAEEAGTLNDQAIISHIFKPGFSALDAPGLHAGRGEGLSVVREALTALGGKLRVASRPDGYTRFVMQLEKETWQYA